MYAGTVGIMGHLLKVIDLFTAPNCTHGMFAVHDKDAGVDPEEFRGIRTNPPGHLRLHIVCASGLVKQ